MCASRGGKSPLANAPDPPLHFMLCQLQDGVIPDREDSELSEVKTSQSQREEVWIRYTTLTQGTSIRWSLDPT